MELQKRHYPLPTQDTIQNDTTPIQGMTEQELLNIQKELLHFAHHLTKQREQAQDLVSATNLRALTNKTKYQTGTNLKQRLYTMMKHIYFSRHRKNKNKKNIKNPISLEHEEFISLQTHNSGESSLQIEEILSLIEHLPDKNKEPLHLSIDGRKYEEIADILKIPIGTVKSRIFFARKSIKKILLAEDQETNYPTD